METARPWKGDASAEVQPAMLLQALQDSWWPFLGMDWLRMVHRRFEPLAPAAAPVTGHPSLLAWRQVDTAQEADKSQSFGFVAVLVAPEVVSCLAAAHFVAAIAAAVAFAECVAAAPVAAAAGDTVGAFAAATAAAAAAAAFVAVGFAVAVAVAAEGDAAGGAAAAAVAAGDGDAFAAAASGGAVVAEI